MSTVAADAGSNLTVSPHDNIVEEEKGNRVSNLQKQLISTKWILDSYKIILLLNDNYEEEYAFLGIQCKELDSLLKSHVHEVSEWYWMYLNKNPKKWCDSLMLPFSLDYNHLAMESLIFRNLH